MVARKITRSALARHEMALACSRGEENAFFNAFHFWACASGAAKSNAHTITAARRKLAVNTLIYIKITFCAYFGMGLWAQRRISFGPRKKFAGTEKASRQAIKTALKGGLKSGSGTRTRSPVALLTCGAFGPASRYSPCLRQTRTTLRLSRPNAGQAVGLLSLGNKKPP